MRYAPAVSVAVWLVVAVAAGVRLLGLSWPAVVLICALAAAAASVCFIDFGDRDDGGGL